MVEAEITCLIRMTRIPDLGLELQKGDKVIVPKEKADASKDLALLKQYNAVRVRAVRRFNKLRETDPPSTGHTPKRDMGTLRPQPPRSAPLHPPVDARVDAPPTGVQPAAPTVDLELLADKLAARLGGAINRVVDAVRESRPVVVNGTPGAVSGAPGTVPDEMPRFIPEKIVDHDAKADIQTVETTGEAKGLDAAKDALRKARGGRKPKER